MPRPKKKNINLSQESLLSLLQEIYNEAVEQRSTAIRIQNKMMAFMKEAADIDPYRSSFKRTTKNNRLCN